MAAHLADIYSQLHYIAREYVFVHSIMGREEEINERHNFLSTAIYYLSLSTFHRPFPSFWRVLSVCGRAALVLEVQEIEACWHWELGARSQLTRPRGWFYCFLLGSVSVKLKEMGSFQDSCE